MSTKNVEIQKLQLIFEKAKTTPRNARNYFRDLELHNDLGDALITVGKKKLYELKNELYYYLHDKFPPFRKDAVMSLGWDTRLKLPTFEDKAYEIWKNDPDEEVCNVALIAWAGYFYGSKNAKILEELYSIFTSENYSVRIRRSALICLMYVADILADDKEANRILFDTNIEDHKEFNSSIDWITVNHIMKTCVPGW